MLDPSKTEQRRVVMAVEANKQIVRRFHTELWAGNLTVVDELLAPDFHSAMGTPQGINAERVS
jgi:hypothetical protein